jgi:hypothetical protein
MNLADYNLTVEDVAAKLGYTPQRVRTLASEAKLPALKRFRKWMFNEAEVLQALRNVSPVAGNTERDNDTSASGTDILS